MEYTEGRSFVAGPFLLGKHTLFESDLRRLERRFPDNSHKYRAHLLPYAPSILDSVQKEIEANIDEVWNLDDDHQLDMPVRVNGESKHNYPDADYLVASTRQLSPPSLITKDGTILTLEAPRHPSFYTGVKINAQLCPLLYAPSEKEDAVGVSLILEAIAILNDNRDDFPSIQTKQRRAIDLIIAKAKAHRERN